ncbi:MAG: hypothetical protein KBD01_02925 [Acidobacteria bacterium]|nr:hypothetical protein [Acidobacteriota bacterium]
MEIARTGAGVGVGEPGTAADTDQRAAIQKAARGLEAALLREMFKAMQRAQLEEGSFFGGSGEAGPRSTLFEVYLTEAIAEREPLGLAAKIADQLTPSGPAASPGASGASKPSADLGSPPRSFGNMRSGAQVRLDVAEKTLGQLSAPVLPGDGLPEDER